jgi:hypothetical protein
MQYFKDVDEKYAIGVPPELCREAKEIIDSGNLDFTDEPSDQAIMELPAQDSVDAVEPHKSRNPKIAPVEIQLQIKPDYADMIESSLRENYIKYKVEIHDDGTRKIFVTQGDDLQAREIVREIEEGSPPQ